MGVITINYYRTNAMYDYLDDNPNDLLKFPKGDLWALIYGDKENFEAHVLVLAVGIKEGEELSESFWEIHGLLNQLGERSNLPVAIVSFRTDITTIEEVEYSEGDNAFENISLLTLADKLRNLGLSINCNPTAKAINKKSSSAFHNWQRDNLGDEIVAVDIDMFKVSREDLIEKFYELKRSYKTLSQWAPYEDDYNNFRVMSNLANRTDIDFDIVYNRRTTNPWFDDIRQVSIFNVDFSKGRPVTSHGIMDINSFMEY